MVAGVKRNPVFPRSQIAARKEKMYEFFATAGRMSWFEIGMLACFASSWPVSIWKTWTLKLGRQKSRTFITLVAVGYACGIAHKILYSMDVVILLYVLNLLMVLLELGLVTYFRWKGKEGKGDRGIVKREK